MTIPMAFIAPGLVKAAVEGRFPRGAGVASLCEAPAEWLPVRGALPGAAPVSSFSPGARNGNFRGRRQSLDHPGDRET